MSRDSLWSHSTQRTHKEHKVTPSVVKSVAKSLIKSIYFICNKSPKKMSKTLKKLFLWAYISFLFLGIWIQTIAQTVNLTTCDKNNSWFPVLSECDINSKDTILSCKKQCCADAKQQYDADSNECVKINSDYSCKDWYEYNYWKQQCCKCNLATDTYIKYLDQFNNASSTVKSCIGSLDCSSITPTDPCCNQTQYTCKQICEYKNIYEQCQISTNLTCVDPTCTEWMFINWECVVNNYGTMWIDCDQDKLINWQCKLNIYETVGIRKWNEDQNPDDFIKDIVNWITMFIWTVVTVALVYSWFMYVYSWMTWADTSTYKKWMLKWLIWILIVGWSYAIIRLVQFLAKGW